MLVEQKSFGRVRVLIPTRNLTGGKETEELGAAADQVLGQGTPRIVIDLEKIDWINSPGLGALVKIYISCMNRGGWMRVAGVGKRIKNMLLVTRVIMLFDTFDTVDEAITPDTAELGRAQRTGFKTSTALRVSAVGVELQPRRP